MSAPFVNGATQLIVTLSGAKEVVGMAGRAVIVAANTRMDDDIAP